jgi:hypothetical protein
MLLQIPNRNINELQVASIKRLIETLKWAKSADIRVRKDGQYHTFEADWLKHMKFLDSEEGAAP